MAEELKKVGLISEERYNAVEEERRYLVHTASQQQLAGLTKKSGRPANFERLETCGSIAEFKDTARRILLEHPEEMNSIIQAAHRFKDMPGGKKLIWLMYQVRDRLAQAPPETHA
ncbi:hypothetical protein KKI17_02465 [Patescibacteria group bacterium]|nr:hypothetical protein [Patescibacteria group bacterium]